MNPVITMMHWSHHLHDSMLFMWHEIDQRFHSHHFWVGVAVTFLIVGFVTAMITLNILR